MQLNIEKPEGCQAAVLYTDTVTDAKGYYKKFTSQLICGINRVSCDADYAAQLFVNENRNKAFKIMVEDSKVALNAMCLGCPNRIVEPASFPANSEA